MANLPSNSPSSRRKLFRKSKQDCIYSTMTLDCVLIVLGPLYLLCKSDLQPVFSQITVTRLLCFVPMVPCFRKKSLAKALSFQRCCSGCYFLCWTASLKKISPVEALYLVLPVIGLCKSGSSLFVPRLTVAGSTHSPPPRLSISEYNGILLDAHGYKIEGSKCICFIFFSLCRLKLEKSI